LQNVIIKRVQREKKPPYAKKAGKLGLGVGQERT
jgi:hypothetical protein